MASELIPSIQRDANSTPRSNLWVLIAILLAFIALSYTAGIVFGYVPEGRRIDAASELPRLIPSSRCSVPVYLWPKCSRSSAASRIACLAESLKTRPVAVRDE